MAEIVTTRLALVAPDPGTSEPVDLADHLGNNWAKIDAVIGATPCTSGTRPGAPFDGQIIRETDTRHVYVWNATQGRWDQVIGARICTSGTRPSNPSDGMFIRETDTGRVYVWNATGSTWDRMVKFTDLTGDLASPIAQLRQTTAQTAIANNSWTPITFDVEDLDTHNGHSTASNTSRYTCQRAGKYRLNGAVAWAGSASGQRWTRWAKNGTEIAGSGLNQQATSAGQAIAPARNLNVTLALNDYVELQALQSSGGALDTYVGVAYAQSAMSVEWISD